MENNLVEPKDIQHVIIGFKKYFHQMVSQKKFNARELKTFMEPYFTESGYRNSKLELGAQVGDKTNILIIHDAGVGDFVVMSAAIREIRRIYPEAYISLIIFPRAIDLAECCPYVDEIISNVRKHDWRNFLEIYKWDIEMAKILLKRRYDIVYSFTHYEATALLTYMSGAKERISVDFDSDKPILSVPVKIMMPLLTVKVPVNLLGVNKVDVHLSLLDYTLHAPVTNRDLEIWYTPLDYSRAKNIIRGNTYYAICMGGSNSKKKWPAKYYAKLASMILDSEANARFILIGGADDVNPAKIFKDNIGEDITKKHVIDLTNKSNYRQSAAILSLCKCYIGNDTGTLHIAAAVKTPILLPSCFPADIKMNKYSTPKAYAPYRVPSVTVQPKHALNECKNSDNVEGCNIEHKSHCIVQITPEKMFEGFKLLKEQINKRNINPLYIN